MRSLIALVTQSIKADLRTIRDISELTGIQITRVHRLKHGHEMKADEFCTLMEFYQLTPQHFLASTIEDEKQKARKEAYEEIWDKAEMMVANKFGTTPELMAWRLTDPRWNKTA
jgi:hypothetical protein